MLSRINPITRIDTYFFKIHSNIVLPKGFFPAGVPVKILKALLLSSILATCPVHLNLIDLITLTTLGERYRLRSSYCEAFSTPHSHPFSAQIFALGICYQIPLAYILPLM